MLCSESKNNIDQDKSLNKCNCYEEVDDYLDDTTKEDIIKDIGLRTAINKQLGKKLLSIVTIDDLNSLNGILDARDFRIKSLEGIQYARNISCLLLQHNSLTDVTPISELKNLEYLSVNYNHIHEFPCMKKMFHLKKAYFSFNHIIEINPLINLPNLTSIYGGNQRIKLDPVKIEKDKTAEVSVESLFDCNSRLILKECSINPQGVYFPDYKTIQFSEIDNQEYACFSFEKIYNNQYTNKPLVFGGIVDITLMK